MVMLEIYQHAYLREYQRRLSMLGAGGTVSTHKGVHGVIIVACLNPLSHVFDMPEMTWPSALRRVQFENSPRNHRVSRGGWPFLARIQSSSQPHMVGRYIGYC
jgi:hypothetical protein